MLLSTIMNLEYSNMHKHIIYFALHSQDISVKPMWECIYTLQLVGTGRITNI